MQNSELPGPIEAYFAAMEAPLQELPAARRDEFVAEARAHLNAMVKARRADGLDEAAAWDAAMKDFGEPGKVGRALWKQWANGAQLESEGAPLSMRELARKYAWRLAAFTLWLALFPFIPSSWYAAFGVMALVVGWGFEFVRLRRSGRKWPLSRILGYVFVTLQVGWAVAFTQAKSYPGVGSSWLGSSWLIVMLVVIGLSLWLKKRERNQRPWQWSALYKRSPVAAEQEYRLSPLLGLAMGGLMGCVAAFSLSVHLGFPATLLFYGAFIGILCAIGWWLRK